MTNPKLEALFTEYASQHSHPTNRLTHKIAIPMIVFHVVAMLDWVHLFHASWAPGGFVSLAEIACVLAAAWYLWADARLGSVMTVLLVLAIPLGRAVPPPAIVAIAIGGWLIQLAGHAVWEKKSPSFFTNLVHTLVGPIFFVAMIFDSKVRQAYAPAAAR